MGSDNEIRRLLALYFDGATTEAQEKELRTYFAHGEVPADLAYAKALFGASAAVAADACPLTDEQLLARLHPAGRPVRQGKRRDRRLLFLYPAAAIALLCCVLRPLVATQRPEVYCYLNGEPVTDPEIALRQADMAGRLLDAAVRTMADGMAPALKVGRSLQAARPTDTGNSPAGSAPRPADPFEREERPD